MHCTKSFKPFNCSTNVMSQMYWLGPHIKVPANHRKLWGVFDENGFSLSKKIKWSTSFWFSPMFLLYNITIKRKKDRKKDIKVLSFKREITSKAKTSIKRTWCSQKEDVSGMSTRDNRHDLKSMPKIFLMTISCKNKHHTL